MREIDVSEAKNTLGSLLDLVERGEEIIITRRGKPGARQAVADIIAMRKGVTLGGDVTLKALISQDRR